MAWYNIFKKKPKQKTHTVLPSALNRTTEYTGAAGRLANQWYSRPFKSPNQENVRSLDETRDLSRKMCAIDPYLSRYHELLSIYVVGKDGIALDPQIKDRTGALAVAVNEEIKRKWSQWGKSVTVDGTMSFLDVENAVIKTVGRDGEAIVRLVRDKAINPFGLTLQLLDPALLDHTYYAVNTDNDNQVIQGVEVDGFNRRVAYYLWTRHADERQPSNVRKRDRIPAEDILHIYENPDGFCLRGRPWTTPVLLPAARLYEFLDSHLVASQLAATTPAFMKTTVDDVTNYQGAVGATNALDGTVSAQTQGPLPQTLNMFGGPQILELPVGRDLAKLDINFPSANIEQTVRTYLRQIAAGLNVNYQTLTTDNANESFSSVRHGSLGERDHWRNVSRWFAHSLHQAIYEVWLQQAILSRALDLPSVRSRDYQDIAWLPRGFVGIDPLKDMAAYEKGLAEGLYTRTDIVAETGGNWKENIRKIAEEHAFADDNGVTLGTDSQANGTDFTSTDLQSVKDEISSLKQQVEQLQNDAIEV